MIFEEVILEDDGFFEDVDWMGQKAFEDYWALQADPRYRADREAFLFEQASGSGDWDY
jgi:hypothetical protein